MIPVFSSIQKHKMGKVGRDLWRSYDPTPLLKHGHFKQVAQNQVQAASEDLQYLISIHEYFKFCKSFTVFSLFYLDL